MNEQELKKLYNALINKGYSARDLGDEQRFMSKMQDSESRRQLYDYVKKRGDFRIGDYNAYEQRLTTNVTQQNAPETGQASVPSTSTPTTPTTPPETPSTSPTPSTHEEETPAPSTPVTSTPSPSTWKPENARVALNSLAMLEEFNQGVKESDARVSNMRKGAGIGNATSELKFNPEKGKVERVYYTTHGDEVTTPQGQARLNQAYTDEWEATTEEGYKHKERRLQNDFERRVSESLSKYDPDNTAEIAWQRAESEGDKEFKAWLDERNKPTFVNAMRDMANASNCAVGVGMDNIDVGIEALAIDLKYKDLQRMADDAWNMLGKEKQDNIIKDMYGALKNRYPQATSEQLQQAATEMAREQSDLRMYELAVAKNAPRDATEYFFRKVFLGNSIGSMMQAAARAKAGTTGDMEAREDAEQRFEKQGHKFAGIAGTVVSFAMDPLTYVSAGAGSSAVKGATWLGGKFIGNAAMRKFGTSLGGRMLFGAVRGGATLATFESGSEMIDQMKWGGYIDEETGKRIEGFSFGNVARRARHGLIMGGVTGVIAPLIGNVSDKLVSATESTVGKMGIRATELGVGTVAEGTIFAVPEIIDSYNQYGDLINSLSDEESPNYIADEQERAAKIEELRNSRGDAIMDVWTDNMAMIAGFKAQHMVKSAPRVITDLASSKSKSGFETRLRQILDGRPDLALTKDEKIELERRGYGDLKDLTEEYARYAKTNEEYAKTRPTTTDASRLIGGELPYNRFVDLMTDNSVSEAARAKMYYYLTGHSLPMSTITGSSITENKDADGNVIDYTVQSLGVNGVITSRSFANKKRADVEVNRINRQAELNSIDVGERYYDWKGDERRMEQACKDVAKDIAGGNNWRFGGNATLWKRLYELMKTKPENMNGVEKEWAKKILDKYIELGEEFEYERYFYEGNGNILSIETETVYGGSRGVREAINNEFGVDVDKAIRKERNRRSEQEQKAVEEYANRLFADVKRNQEEAAERGEEPIDPDVPPTNSQIAGLLGIDDGEPSEHASAAFSRGYDADAQERRDIAIELTAPNNAEAQEAWNGVVQRINEDAAYLAAQQREQSKQIMHKKDGTFRPATLKEQDSDGNDQQVYIVDGNVQMMADGSMVDPEASDKSVVIFYPTTGEPRIIDPTADTGISSLGVVTTAEQREADIERSRQEYVQAQIDEARGAVRITPGQDITLPTGENAVVIATDASGEDITVRLDDGTQANVQRSELQRIHDEKALADYRQRHGIEDAQPATQGEAPSAEPQGTVAGAPAEYTADMELTIRDEDGSEKPAMVMGRVRSENGSLVPDANGNIIEYFMDGEVKHDRKDQLDNKVVSHVVPAQPEHGNNTQENIPQTPIETPKPVEQPAEIAPQPVQEHEQTVEPQPAQPEAPVETVETERPTTDAMPMREDGEEDWQATTPERAHAYIFNEAGLSRSEGNEFISAQKQAAQSALAKAKSAKMPKIGTSIKAYNEAKAKRQEKIDEAQRVLDYWNGVQEIQSANQREENERRAAEQAVLHDEAVARFEEEQRVKAQKQAEQDAIGSHAVNSKIKEKWDVADKVEGQSDIITLPDGSQLRGKYVLYEAGSASASHDPNSGYVPTEGFPVDENGQSVNDRDYHRDKDAQRIVENMAEAYDSRALQNPVIVSQDGIVLSGNNRTMSGDLAARRGTDTTYIDYLKEFGGKYGFTAGQIEEMQHPRVAFVPDEPLPYNAATFARFNAQEMKSQSKPETAVKLGKIVPEEVFNGIVGDISRYDNMGDFYRDDKATARAIGGLLQAGVINNKQLPELRTGTALSSAGKELIENTLIGKVFQSNPDAVRQLIGMPGVRQSVVMALSEIASNRMLSSRGYDLGAELASAIDLVSKAKTAMPDVFTEGVPVSPFGRQKGLFDDEFGESSVTDATILLLSDILNSNKPGDLRKVLAMYNQEAQQAASGQMDIFSGEIESKETILKRVNEYFNNATTNEKQAIVESAIADRKNRAEQQSSGGGTQGEQIANVAERGGERQDRAEGGRDTDVRGGTTDDATNKGLEEVDDTIGPFGEIYRQFKGKPKEAITFLLAKRSGEAIGALHHKDIGDIDLVWGDEGTGHSDGYGLAKLAKYHPEVLFNIQEILNDMVVTKRSANRVQLESDRYQAAVRLTWDNKKKTWLLTMFEKKNSALDNTTDTGKTLMGNGNDTATPESTVVSDSKDIEKSRNSNELGEKSDVSSVQGQLDGFEGYSREEVKDMVLDTVSEILSDVDVEIVGIELHGSRNRGDSGADSDLDVVLEYSGDFKEDAMFNLLHADPIEINGVVVDVNPIRKEESGTLADYMKRSRGYDAMIREGEVNTNPTEAQKEAGKAESHDETVAERTRKIAERFSKMAEEEERWQAESNAVQAALTVAEQETNVNPTEAQIEAGNYKKGHVKIDGYDVTIENPKGSVRSGVDADGKKWETEMQNTYGYIRGTEGVDGDHIDVFFSEDPSQGDVFVVDQVNKDGSFDEHKVMYGFPDIESARKAYLSNYNEGWQGLGSITGVSKEEFKKWINSSHRKTKPFAEYKSVKPTEGQSAGADMQYGGLAHDVDNGAFKVATERTMEALVATGVEVVPATEEMVAEMFSAVNAERQMIADANERFNRELQQQIDGTLPKGHVYELGMPSAVLQSAGLPYLPIELAASRLTDKSMQENHPFELSEVENLVESVQNPLAVFRSATHIGSYVVLTEIQHGGKNYVVAIETHRKQGKNEINSVRSAHYRNSNKHIANWIEEGLLEYADKKRMSEWLSKQRYNSADVRNLFRHSAKIVESFENPKDSAEFSRMSAPFYSNARRAVLDIKQEKGTPEQWIAMLKKNGGLKAGEDAWVGLEKWLNERKGTVTKQEIVDYLNEKSIQIEEVEYGETGSLVDELNDNREMLMSHAEDRARQNYEDFDEIDDASMRWDIINDELVSMLKEAYGEDIFDKVEYDVDLNFSLANGIKPINSTRLEYTTKGLKGKREIVLTVPTIEPYNTSDEIHFGEAGSGRAVAWVRFGETEDSEGNRVLVIDEIQSKRHQDGREKGYKSVEAETQGAEALEAARKTAREYREYHDQLKVKYGDPMEVRGTAEERKAARRQWREQLPEEERTKLDELRQRNLDAAAEYERISLSNRHKVPEAPFEKNWHELAMKRMLRYAAENGYDKVAWTTGAQQAERYDISRLVEEISVEENTIEEFSDGTPVAARITISTTSGDIYTDIDAAGVVHGGEYSGKELEDVVGKELANRIKNDILEAKQRRESAIKAKTSIREKMKETAEDGAEYEELLAEYGRQDEIAARSMAKRRYSGGDLRIGGEGMKGFYDKMLPSFVQKYTKKWGARVGDVTLPGVEESGRKMHAVDVTAEMRESVMEGQPMFLRTSDGKIYGWSLNGKIYLTADGVNPETPVHEYTHLWANALEQSDPKEWKEIVEGLKGSSVWNDVMRDEHYRDIWHDERRVASEVLSRLAGKENYRREMERAEQEIKEATNPFDVAEKVSAWERVKEALRDFWNKVKRLLTGKAKEKSKVLNSQDEPWIEFVERPLRDFWGGVNPNVKRSPMEKMFVGERGAQRLDNAEEATTRYDNLAIAREMERKLTEIEKGKLNSLTTEITNPGNGNNSPLSDVKDKRLATILQINEKENARRIKLATGWERGADGKWRYEIEDLGQLDLKPINLSTELVNGKMWIDGEITLGELFYDNDLFKSYPALKDVKVAFGNFENSGTKGKYDAETNTISLPKEALKEVAMYSEENARKQRELLNEIDALQAEHKKENLELAGKKLAELGKLSDDAIYGINIDMSQYSFGSIMAHEIQHAIQHIEGFARGGNTSTVETKAGALRNDVQPLYKMMLETPEWAEDVRLKKKLLDEWEKEQPDDAIVNALEKRIDEIHDSGVLSEINALKSELSKKYGSDATVGKILSGPYADDAEIWEQLPESFVSRYEAYRTLAGEVESRNVQSRMNMTAEERRNSLAKDTEDVAREDQIFLYDNLGEEVALQKNLFEESIKTDTKAGSHSGDDAKLSKEIVTANEKEERSDDTALYRRSDAIKDRIEVLFNQAISGEFKGKPISIGRLTESGKRYLEQISGVSFKDKVDFVLNPSDLVHIYKGHFGNNETDERSVPLDIEDIRSIVDVVSFPDRIIYAKEKAGEKRKMFFFLKEAEKGTYNLLEIYADKKGNLTAKTFYKTKEGVSQRAMTLSKSLHTTSETDGATLNDDANIPQMFESASVGVDYSGEDRDMMSSTVEQMGEKLHTGIDIIEDVNEITHQDAEIEANRRRSKGWYDIVTRQVHVVLPNNRDIDDVKATVAHETIAHKGLRELVGEENYDEFLDETYQHLYDDLKKGVDAAAGRAFVDDITKNGKRANSYEHHRRNAMDELFGRMAEKPFEEFSEGERTLWQKIKETVRRLLDKFLGGSLKLPKWFKIGGNELRYMLWRSKERLERGKEHPIDLARDIVKREELGLTEEARYKMGDVAEPSFASRRDRAVNKRGYVHAGLNSTEVKVVSIKEKTPFDTSKKTKVLKEDVVAYANEHNIIGTMTEDETKGKGQISISKTSIEKMVDDSATSKSVDKGTHLAVIPQLREIIAESVMAETHPDYNKSEDGKRSPENGYNPDNLIHRCYGAISVDGQEYRVKLTLKETSGNRKSKKAYSYEVTKIEVLDGQTTKPLSVSSRKSNTPNGRSNVSDVFVSGAKLLQNVEKSYDNGKKLLEESKKADESTDLDNPLTLGHSSELDASRSTADLYRVPDETEDIWNDMSMDLQERITAAAAATRLANNHRDNKTLRNDAMRAIGGNLSDLRKAMSLQRTFDMTTVKRVADLARVLISNGYLNDLSPNEIKRLLSAVKNSVGHNDIEKSVQKVMDIMVDNQLKLGKSALHELEAIKGSKVDARGVEVQGQLDPAGQVLMEAFKDGRRLTREALEEEIGKTLDRMSSASESVRADAENAYAGLQFALQYAERIADSEHAEKVLRDELKQKHDETSERDRATDSYRQYVAATEDAIRQNKIERAQSYFDLVSAMTDGLRESVANAKAFKESERTRIQDIHHFANSDMQGMELRGHRPDSRLDRLNENSIVRFGLSPLHTFDQFMRLFGRKNADGKGYLYDHFMRKFIDSADHEQLMKEKYEGMLEAKVGELFGTHRVAWNGGMKKVPYTFTSLYGYVDALPMSKVTYYDGAGSRTYDLSQAQLAYLYAVDKMPMGKATNRRMGVTDELMEQIAEGLDPKLKEFVDWAQEDFLVGLGNECNEVHKRMFGANMANIENYFPFVRDKNAIKREVENGGGESLAERISTKTGAIIKRTPSVANWDLPNANFLDVLAKHVSEMCQWSSYAELNRDLGTLQSYNRFKQQVLGMRTIYGSGDALWKRFMQTCAIAGNAYEPKRGEADKLMVKGAKGVTIGKIAFRPYTALKQMLSLPAFFGEVDMLTLSADLSMGGVPAVKWAWENMPNFRKRIKSRTTGDFRLSETEYDKEKGWTNRLMKISAYGMMPNIGVDAWTIALGSHAMYVKEKKKYLRQGYSEEKAERRAIQDAELCFNKSQQSSEGAFMAPVQIDHTFASTTMMLFRNSSTSYTRETIAGVRNLKRMMSGEVDVDFMAKQILRNAEIPTFSMRFDAELEQQVDGTLPVGHIYSLGMPGGVLQSAGFPDAPIEMSSTRLAEKANDPSHPFPIAAVKGLVDAMNEPIAVFRYGNNAMNVIVGLEYKGKQFLVGVHFNQHRGGMDVLSVRGLFPKDNAEWLNWISQGKATYLDHKRIKALIAQQRINLADVDYLDLKDVLKVMENFENPAIPEQKNFSVWHDEDVEQARKQARKDYRGAYIRNSVNAVVFGYILPWLWRIGGISALLTLGGDDDDKEEEVKKETKHSLFGPLEGLAYGDVLADGLYVGFDKLFGSGEEKWSNVGRTNPFMSDLAGVLSKLDGDKMSAINDVLNILVGMNTGVNLQTVSDWATAILDYSPDGDTSREVSLLVARLLNAPQSQIDKIYFEEIGLYGEDALRLSPQELVERYAAYKVKRDHFVTPWVWGDEDLLDKKRKIGEKVVKEHTEQMGDDKVNEAYLQYEEVYKGVNAKMKEANKMLKTDYVEAARLMADIQKDTKAFETYQMFKMLDGYYDKIVEYYLGSKTSEEATLCKEAALAYKSGMVKVLQATDTATRAEAMKSLENILDTFTKKHTPMQQNTEAQ